MKCVRHNGKTLLMITLALGCMALVLLWPKWRDELHAQAYCTTGVDRDCEMGQICISSRCISGCRSDRDCRSDQICQGLPVGSCETLVAREACTCESANDCPGSEECFEGGCTPSGNNTGTCGLIAVPGERLRFRANGQCLSLRSDEFKCPNEGTFSCECDSFDNVQQCVSGASSACLSGRQNLCVFSQIGLQCNSN